MEQIAKDSNRLRWIILGAVFVIAPAAILYYNSSSLKEFTLLSTYVEEKKPAEFAWVEIDLGGDQKRVFKGKLNGNSYSLSDALKHLSAGGKISFKEKNNRLYEAAGVSGVWVIYKNGARTDAPLSDLAITGGDRYVFRLEAEK